MAEIENAHSPIIAACDTCGMGFLSIHKWGMPCGVCDHGKLWYLPQPLENLGNRQPLNDYLVPLAKRHHRSAPTGMITRHPAPIRERKPKR